MMCYNYNVSRRKWGQNLDGLGIFFFAKLQWSTCLFRASPHIHDVSAYVNCLLWKCIVWSNSIQVLSVVFDLKLNAVEIKWWAGMYELMDGRLRTCGLSLFSLSKPINNWMKYISGTYFLGEGESRNNVLDLTKRKLEVLAEADLYHLPFLQHSLRYLKSWC